VFFAQVFKFQALENKNVRGFFVQVPNFCFFEELGRGRGVVPGDDRSEELEAA